MQYTIELDREEDGRWIAEIPQLPGVMVYGATEAEAIKDVKALALRVLADQIEQSKQTPCEPTSVYIPCPREKVA